MSTGVVSLLTVLFVGGLASIRCSPVVGMATGETSQQYPTENLREVDGKAQAYETDTDVYKTRLQRYEDEIEKYEAKIEALKSQIDGNEESMDDDATVERRDSPEVAESDEDDVAAGTGTAVGMPTHWHRYKVAFYAGVSRDRSHIGHYQTIVFDRCFTNIGHGYNVHSGHFHARYRGVYVFIWTTTNVNGNYMNTELMVNGAVYGRQVSDAEGRRDSSSASGTVVLHLHAGSNVWVRSTSKHDGHLKGNLMSYFAGWMLFSH